jgi:type I restriction enzyme S subunit
VIGFIPDPEKADPRFIKYLFDAKLKLSFQQFTQGAAQDNLSQGKLLSLKFQVPENVEDQKRIADRIAIYDDLIENNHRRIQLLEDAARLLYREWFIYLRFPGHEHVKIVDGVPEGWHKQRLDDVAVINAESLKSNFQGRIEYIDISCVSTDSIDSTNWYEFEDAPGRARRILRDKDIIWSCVRPNRKSHAFIWQPHDRLIASTGFAVISAKTISPFFLYQTLSTSEYVGYLTNNAGGVAYPAVTAKVFEDSIILVPPNSITDTFDSFVSKSYQQINLLQQANKKLIEARDLLLPRLMSGEISV